MKKEIKQVVKILEEEKRKCLCEFGRCIFRMESISPTKVDIWFLSGSLKDFSKLGKKMVMYGTVEKSFVSGHHKITVSR